MGGKTRETIFQNKPIVPAKKCWDKNCRKKLRKKVFYIHTNIVTKNGGEKRAKQFLQKHTNNARKICWGKKSLEKSSKTRFLYSHEYHDQKMGKKRAKQFFQKHTNSASKKCWGKKSSEKS